MKPSDTLAHIQRISCLGLPSEVSIPAMVDALDGLVPSANSDFTWTTRKGGVANLYARWVTPSSLDIMLNHSHLLRRPGELSFEMHSCSKLVTGNLERFRAFENFERTIAYNELWKPNALAQLLDLVIYDSEGPRGLLAVGRATAELAFTIEDTRRVISLLAWFKHALDAPIAGQASAVEGGEEAVLLCDRAGKVRHMGPNAAKLLLYAGNGQVKSGAMIAGLGDAAPEAVRRLCLNLARVLNGQPGQAPRAQIKSPFGTYNFRAHVLDSELIVVVIRQQQPLALALANRVRELPLTQRQRQVAVMVGLGRSPDDIQDELELSPGTLRRHMEDIHVRLCVHSRAELMSLLMTRGGPHGHA